MIRDLGQLLNEHTDAHAAELFSVFSDTYCVRIVSAIIGREINVSKLADLIGISESAISHHMRHLMHEEQ